ncbi:MAG: hypothetical protein V2B13_09525 [Pseudomonadota bacterium]
MPEPFDQQEIYCPHLGMMITFSYCRQAQSPLPCRNMIGCWEKRLPIGNFLIENYSREELEVIFGELPKTRLERIFDCVERTKEAK